ncbi:gametocyte-specific factor 1 [Melopsittacus undulatus]|nr:gametocyte-specific factor 1 [Melopsittacus undulatus]
MELEDDFDAFDPERLVQCPYNKHHRIRACRFPYHLVKCKKSYPEVAKQLATCPFNARHLIPQADLSDHIAKCSYKGLIEQDVGNQPSDFKRDEMNAVSTWQAPPCDEDWEAELLEQSDSPFIWGMCNSGINSSSTTSGRESYLPSGVRAPEISPYTPPFKR